VVTANLYRPAEAAAAGRFPPGLLISHSHHAAKTQAELQDMGINWARVGCVVLVPDHVGHGERRQHPFVDAGAYAGSFRPGRQDYYFRYNTSRQLHVAGESLIGWMAWDLMRGVDVLLGHGGADAKRIILIGAVAGGGDPAGVAAALDARVAAVVPFNFGGPQPDYPIPADAERDFGWFGEPYWESTRCLRGGAADGFAHWTIVASVAPRRLVYAHEFAWERNRDPAWPRVERVFAWHDAADHLASAQGRGTLKGQPPEASHCTNVGPIHRAAFYPALQRWFEIAPPAKENAVRHKAEELVCLTPAAVAEFKPRPLHELAGELAAARVGGTRRQLEKLSPGERRRWLRDAWSGLLGGADPTGEGKPVNGRQERVGEVSVERVALGVEAGITVPMVILVPPRAGDARMPTVVTFARAGKGELLRQRAGAIAELLGGGTIVYLVDVRGTGETAPASKNRGRGSESTSWSQGELMLGRTMLGGQLRDLRCVLRHLRARPDVDGGLIAVWGDSLAAVNGAGTRLDVPADAEPQPGIAEPSAGMLAMLAMLFEEDLRAACAVGGPTSHASWLGSPFLYVPQDAVMPGAASAGDWSDLAAALAPRGLRIDSPVDGLNRRTGIAECRDAFARAVAAYRAAGAEPTFSLVASPEPDPVEAVRWLSQQLK
jgi:hypothetical protein